jgi:uncharacterized protein Smg (DUF494 family)
MHDKIIDLVVYILREIKTLGIKLQDFDTGVLEKLGYSKDEMNMAFSWLFDRLCLKEVGSTQQNEVPYSFRVLHEMERMAISPEAHGFLIQLRELDVISNDDLEDIVEKIMMSQSYSIELDEMKDMVSSLIFNAEENVAHRSSPYDNETIH